MLCSIAKKEKMAILISSHNLAELDNLSTKVCIIKNGEIIETSDIESIKKESKEDYQVFEVDNTEKIKSILKSAIILDERHFKIDIQKGEIPEIVKLLVKEDISLYKIQKEEISLEKAFFEKTGGNVIE